MITWSLEGIVHVHISMTKASGPLSCFRLGEGRENSVFHNVQQFKLGYKVADGYLSTAASHGYYIKTVSLDMVITIQIIKYAIFRKHKVTRLECCLTHV